LANDGTITLRKNGLYQVTYGIALNDLPGEISQGSLEMPGKFHLELTDSQGSKVVNNSQLTLSYPKKLTSTTLLVYSAEDNSLLHVRNGSTLGTSSENPMSTSTPVVLGAEGAVCATITVIKLN